MTQEPPTSTDQTPSCCGGGSCCSGPGKWMWLLLAAAIIAIVIVRHVKQTQEPPVITPPPAVITNAARPAGAGSVQGKSLPRLVDLGAGKCIPCKLMAPMLEELKKTQADKFEVQFIDVWENPDPGRQYGIRVIPTQIFFAPDGKELFRHEGFFSKEDILAKWKELEFE